MMDGNFDKLFTSDVVGLGGQSYDHCIVSSGYLGNPLLKFSQVSFYGAITGNEYATAHVAGFESAVGLSAGLHTSRVNAYNVANINMGVGAVADQYVNFSYSEDSPATSNAVIAAGDDHDFTGNWFINYRGARPSKLMGDIGFGRAPDSVSNARVISLDGSQYDFVRFYINGTESFRIAVTATDTFIDNYGTGTLTLRGGSSRNVALVVNADGTVRIPSLAGSGDRAVKAASNGLLSAP